MNSNQGEFMYALYFEYAGKRYYFYVGRSGRGINRSPGVRFGEHKAHARYDTTPVYVFIREELEDLNIPWFEEILCWVDADEATTNDTEFYWVVKMIQDGHSLQNAKNGDAKKFADAQDAASSGFEITCPADVKVYRTFTKDQLRQNKAEKLRMSILEKEKAKNAFFEAKWSKSEMFASLNKAKSTPNDPNVEPMKIYSDLAQEAFECGKYAIALTYLGKSHTKFAEQFGITYNECVQ